MRLTVVCLFMMCLAISARSHPVSISWITGKMEHNQITISYKIFAEDLIYYHHPEHDENYDYDVDVLKSLAKIHGELILKNFRIKYNQGDFLEAKLVAINDRSLTSGKVNVMNLMKYEITYRIEFHFNTEEWKSLTFTQNLGRHKAGIPSITFLSVFENEVVLIENGELTLEQPITLIKGEERTTLKPSELTSSYFTVSSFGIRHELTIPTETFNTLLLQSQTTDSTFTNNVINYFNIQNAVFNNAKKLTPKLAHITTLTNNDSGSGFTYVDIFYPTIKYPSNLLLTWSDYNWQFKWFNSEIITIDSLYQHTFSRYQPKLIIKPSIKIDKND